MHEDETKPKSHLHLGGIIIVIIIIIILFKVDIKAKLNSPEFQKNITYIKTEVMSLYKKYILDPFKIKANEVFIDATNKGVKEIQDNFSKKILNTEDIEKTTN
jgi:hypothetical protein